jgi:hypothetical protein
MTAAFTNTVDSTHESIYPIWTCLDSMADRIAHTFDLLESMAGEISAFQDLVHVIPRFTDQYCTRAGMLYE